MGYDAKREAERDSNPIRVQASISSSSSRQPLPLTVAQHWFATCFIVLIAGLTATLLVLAT